MQGQRQGQKWLQFAAYNLAAVALGIAVGLAVVAFAGGKIDVALYTILAGPITSSAGVQQTFVRFVILYTIGLGVGLALKAGLWNVGGQGQLVIGMMMVFVVYTYARFLAWPLLFVLFIVAGALGGLLWITVPAILKTKFGANEIVVTLLLNIVASNFGLYMLNGPIRSSQSPGYPITDTLPVHLRIPQIVPGSGITYAVPAVIALGVFLYFVVERTSFNVEANTVGASTETARYAGVSVTRVVVITMLGAGALAGLGGALLVMGFLYHLDAGQFSTNYGLLAIIVALLGRKSMLGIGVASVLFAYLSIGAEQMAVATNVQTSIVFAMEGVMLIGVLFSSYLLARRQGR
jgi:general nucleoside transport system permease protein